MRGGNVALDFKLSVLRRKDYAEITSQPYSNIVAGTYAKVLTLGLGTNRLITPA